MIKIMDAMEFERKNNQMGTIEIMEEYYQYRKGNERCRTCKHWLCKKPTDTYAICTEWSPEDKRENWTCHQWQEREG